ncbi:hypothetical protein Cma02nite_34330 [Cellulomonas marina]|nr:hypothetical protein Cma02nite_34330 [Cellulomonas marina]
MEHRLLPVLRARVTLVRRVVVSLLLLVGGGGAVRGWERVAGVVWGSADTLLGPEGAAARSGGVFVSGPWPGCSYRLMSGPLPSRKGGRGWVLAVPDPVVVVVV